MNVQSREIAGMRVLFMPRPDRGTVGIALHVRAGSLFEDPSTRGAAHFLEHLVVRGSKRFPQREAIALLERAPRSFFAGTGRERCMFESHLPAAFALSGIEALVDAVFAPLLRETDIAQERAIVLDELRWRASADPARSLLDALTTAIWPERLAGPVAGDAPAVERLRREDLVRFHSAHFRPERAVLAIVGAFDPETAEERVADVLRASRSQDGPPRPRPSEPGPNVFVDGDNVADWLLVAHVAVDVDWRGHSVGRALAQHANCTGVGTLSRELRDSKLGLYSWECSYHAIGQVGVLATYIEVPTDHREAAADAAVTALCRTVSTARSDSAGPAQLSSDVHAVAIDGNGSAARVLAENSADGDRRSHPFLADPLSRPEIAEGLRQLRAGRIVVVGRSRAIPDRQRTMSAS